MVSDIFLELVRLNPFQKGIACRNRSKITDFMENFQSLVKKWQKLAKNRFFSAAQAFFHPRTDFFIPYALYTCPESGIWPGTLNSKIEPTLLWGEAAAPQPPPPVAPLVTMAHDLCAEYEIGRLFEVVFTYYFHLLHIGSKLWSKTVF